MRKSDENPVLGHGVSCEVMIYDILKPIWMLAFVGLTGIEGSSLICSLSLEQPQMLAHLRSARDKEQLYVCMCVFIF